MRTYAGGHARFQDELKCRWLDEQEFVADRWTVLGSDEGD
jgi:hypothetical protein